MPRRNAGTLSEFTRHEGEIHRHREFGMARCDQGYLCEVCGAPVPEIVDSDLYLSFILGLVDSRALLARPERHIRCNPVQAQFIVDERFSPVTADGPFDKRGLDREYVRVQEDLVTRAWRRLQEIPKLGIAIPAYPLPEVQAAALQGHCRQLLGQEEAGDAERGSGDHRLVLLLHISARFYSRCQDGGSVDFLPSRPSVAVTKKEAPAESAGLHRFP